MELLSHEKIEELMISDYKIIQSDKLYRFTSDSVLLSRFAPEQKNALVCDLCAGSGIVGLHYYALHDSSVKGVDLIEIQPDLSDMSKKSIALNALEGVICAYNKPIQQVEDWQLDKYSLVLCNPPYKKAQSGFTGEFEHLAICKHEITVTLEDIVLVASKILKRGGSFCFCNKCERLVEAFDLLKKYKLSPKRLQFLCGNEKSKPYLFMLEAKKGVKAQLEVLPSITNSTANFSGEIIK